MKVEIVLSEQSLEWFSTIFVSFAYVIPFILWQSSCNIENKKMHARPWKKSFATKILSVCPQSRLKNWCLYKVRKISATPQTFLKKKPAVKLRFISQYISVTWHSWPQIGILMLYKLYNRQFIAYFSCFCLDLCSHQMPIVHFFDCSFK